jgi:glutaredoxin
MIAPAIDFRPAALASVALLLGALAFPACAQYKIVAPDGSVTYTDRPPAGTVPGTASTSNSTMAAPGAGALPLELRQAAQRFPVALYATRPCVPCDQARQWLRQRGVPFREYTVDKPADVTTLKGRFGDTQLPVVTIGGQVIKGFSSADLQSFVDAAGYPKENRLGAAYTWPSAESLAPPAQVVTAPAPAPAAPPPPPPPPAPPSGIQF